MGLQGRRRECGDAGKEIGMDVKRWKWWVCREEMGMVVVMLEESLREDPNGMGSGRRRKRGIGRG